MFLDIDPRDAVPIFRQIADQVRRAIASGSLRPGDRLPSVREVGRESSVNPMTVQKAYSELEHDGLLESRRGQGTFVSALAQRARLHEKRKMVEPLAAELVRRSREVGLSDEEIRGVLEKVLTQSLRKRGRA